MSTTPTTPTTPTPGERALAHAIETSVAQDRIVRVEVASLRDATDILWGLGLEDYAPEPDGGRDAWGIDDDDEPWRLTLYREGG